MYGLMKELNCPINLLEGMYLFSWEVKEALELRAEGIIVLEEALEVISGYKAKLIV
jgi:hypothetical protein